MGGGATWYRIKLLDGQGEQGFYKLESCFIPAGQNPEVPHYEEDLALATFVGLQDVIPEYTFNQIREDVLALTKEKPVLEYKPYPKYFAP